MENVNVQAPDVNVMLADGTRQRLSAFWQNGDLLLVFLRHLG